MIITDIVSVTTQKYRITTDEQLAFVLYKGELSHYQLEKDMELTEEVWEEIWQVLRKRAKLRAMHLLTKKDYTEKELYQKLMDGEYTKEAVEEAISYVRSFHYLDDERYARRYMNQSNNGKSRRQKEYELEQKGISKELLRTCVGEEFEDEIPLILSLLKKRCKNVQQIDEKEKAKHYAYLMRKGFSSGDIMRAFETFFDSDCREL